MRRDHDIPLLVIRQSIFNQLGLLLATIIAAGFAIWATAAFPWSVQSVSVSPLGTLPLPLFGLIPLVLLAALVHGLLNVKLIFCKEYVLLAEGIIDWKEKTMRVEYEHIREIEIDQTLPQKLFGIGDVIVTLVSTSLDSSMKMPGVRNPRRVKNLIRDYVARAEERNVAMGMTA